MTPRSRSLHALAAVGCALALAASGCGGDDDDGDSGGGSSQAAPASTAGGAAAASVDGKEVFASNCASCHTLADADASGSMGPNLDETKPDVDAVSAQVKSGGGGMPAFEGQLSPEEIDAVATYVAENAGK